MALSRDKQIIVGLVVLAGLGALAYRQIVRDQALGSPQAAALVLPTSTVSDDLDKISITHGDKGEVVLRKKDDKWLLEKPVTAPANAQNIKSLLENLKEVKLKEIVAPSADEALQKQYELDAEHVVHVVAWKGDEKKLDERFGKSGGRGELMMVDGDARVFAASGYSSYLYTRDLKGWRDTEIFKFDDTNAVQITIERKDATFSFTKGEKWVGTMGGKPIDKFDEDKVKDALRVFKSLTADDFADSKTATDTGLDTPAATLTITLRDNAGKYTLKLGKISSGSSHYAHRGDDPTNFVVGSSASGWILGDVSKFQRSPDAGAKGPSHGDPDDDDGELGMHPHPMMH